MKKVIATSLLFLCLGCANLTLRPVTPKRMIGPFDCTAAISEVIANPYDSMRFPYTATQYTGATIEWCGAVIDWPFDALTDLLLWPWDAFWYHRGYPK